ncbi:MAG: hypothetical protein A3G76_05110 [Acidobacteria bacterium RIFCSPLOWO2_12_FULL_65_11]|nr:MAG: hypothetical protein A3H95_10465 [Acidobacteria bacterium RIFCSPLOWO2_02_FULL_64_15]OFW31771.1 MAG: hypothetical protein A3G76_05110 [Acidobacteria bacterium RIFCSPLOWO2_12_FULL_65_11]
MMKHLIGATMAALLLAGTTVAAEQRGKQKGQDDAKHASRGNERDERTNVSVRVAWGARDVEVIRAHYAPQRRSLPPGLAKKYARTGQLPPGWQKKMQPIPVEVERRLPPLPAGYRRGVIDARAVIYDSRGMIIDVAVLF